MHAAAGTSTLPTLLPYVILQVDGDGRPAIQSEPDANEATVTTKLTWYRAPLLLVIYPMEFRKLSTM